MALHLGQADRYTDTYARFPEGQPSYRLLNEITQHLLRHHIVGDDAVLQGLDLLQVAGRAGQLDPRLFSNGAYLILVSVIGCDRGFLQNNAPAAHIHQNAACAQIDSYIRYCHLILSFPAVVRNVLCLSGRASSCCCCQDSSCTDARLLRLSIRIRINDPAASTAASTWDTATRVPGISS